jgi:2,3-bisphosphoglycerate-independent phosphoglycerate mutase
MNSLWENFVHTQLIAHGESVGLTKHEPGNTETGHLNLGAGSIVYQDLPRINISIADGSFFQNPQLIAAAKHAKANNSQFHLMGLVGSGGVHSNLSHFIALIQFCHQQQLEKVFLHLFTDGRDSPPTSSMNSIKQLQVVISRESVGNIATIMGRYYAMDRDFRWDRTEKAYLCLTASSGKTAPNVETAISQSYSLGVTDEFIEPTVILGPDNTPISSIKSGDSVIFVNFRIDRPRQLTKAFVLPDFEKNANIIGFDPYMIDYLGKHVTTGTEITQTKPFNRGSQLSNLFFVTMTEYEKNLPVKIAYPPQIISNPLGKVVSDNHLKQLRLAESEKERFVTYYFNGLVEEPFPGEDRQIIPSPKVPTYDKKPEMSAFETTKSLIEHINSKVYDLIIINYANPDMVGHTGNVSAAVEAVQVTDKCIGELSQSILSSGGVLLITADHGNVEEMRNYSTGQIDTEHNANPVPFIVVGSNYQTGKQISQGILADVSPTILSILQIPTPLDMTGRNLLG